MRPADGGEQQRIRLHRDDAVKAWFKSKRHAQHLWLRVS
jgi:hypothetical protein